jgi:hypothetical protein
MDTWIISDTQSNINIFSAGQERALLKVPNLVHFCRSPWIKFAYTVSLNEIRLNASVVKLIFNNDKKITLQNSYIIWDWTAD